VHYGVFQGLGEGVFFLGMEAEGVVDSPAFGFVVGLGHLADFVVLVELGLEVGVEALASLEPLVLAAMGGEGLVFGVRVWGDVDVEIGLDFIAKLVV